MKIQDDWTIGGSQNPFDHEHCSFLAITRFSAHGRQVYAHQPIDFVRATLQVIDHKQYCSLSHCNTNSRSIRVCESGEALCEGRCV
jgi:hypothetical protein